MKLLGFFQIQTEYGATLGRVKDYDEKNEHVLDAALPNYDGKSRRIFDALNLEIREVVRCDLKTGECILFASHHLHIDENGEEVMCLRRAVFPAPLRAEILEPKE